MKHDKHDEFIAAIHSRNKLKLRFLSDQDYGAELIRTCAPFDFGPSRRAHDQTPRYHFWDYDSDTKQHNLGLLHHRIVDITVLTEKFDPATLVIWNVAAAPWFIKRDWGIHS